MKLDELFVALGFKVDDKDLQKAQTTLDGVKKSALGLKLAIGTVAYGLNRMLTGTIQGTAELEKFSQTTGLAIDKLQSWQEAGQKIDLTLGVDTIKNSIVSLQKNLDNIKLGKGDIGAFQILGIDIAGKDAFQVLESLRGSLGKVNNSVAKSLIERMGLDSSFLTLLRTSRVEFEALGKQIQLTAGQRQDMLALGFTLKEIKLNAISLKNQISASLTPAINKFSQSILIFYKKNVKEIMGLIKGLGNAISSIVQIISNSFQVIANVISTLYTGIKNILGVEGAIVAFGVILAKAFKPFQLAIIALFLILDDISVWLKGGDSLFGNFYQSIANGIKVIQPLIDKILELREALADRQSPTTMEALKSEGGESKIKRYGASAIKFGATGAVAGSLIPGLGTAFGAGLGAVFGIAKNAFEDITIAKPYIQELQAPALERLMQEYRQSQGITQNNNVNITQNISGDNSSDIADKVINNAGGIISDNIGGIIY